MKHTVFRIVCGSLLGLLLSGCSLISLAPNPAPRTYLFDLPFDTNAVQSAGDITLMVSMPLDAPGFNTAHMIYVKQPQMLEHYAFSQWADTPAKMLLPLLVHSLERSGQFANVVAAPAPAAGRWRLDTEILRLQQEFIDTPSQLRLVIRARVIDLDNREIIGSRLFEELVEADGNDAESGVAAANIAVAQFLEKLSAFVTETLTGSSS